MAESLKTLWPKPVYQLTPREEKIKLQLLLEMQDWGYTGLLGRVQRQGHVFVERLSRAKGKPHYRSLEIGCGSGYHFHFVQGGDHTGLDLSTEHLERARLRFPEVQFIKHDAYNLPFPDAFFDRVVSIYVFEHLHRLPECLAEAHRVLKRDGELLVALPCEGGWAYDLGRRLTSKRFFERRFNVDYLNLVKSEHCNTYQEVMEELKKLFRIEAIRYLPFRIPSVHLNATVAMRCVLPG